MTHRSTQPRQSQPVVRPPRRDDQQESEQPELNVTGRYVTLVVLAIVLTMVLSLGVALKIMKAGPFMPQSITVTGSVTVPSSHLGGDGETCLADDGYDDIAAGAQVVVKNADQKTVGVGDLRAGYTVGGVSCTFPFRLAVTPDGSRYYALAVGNNNRGDMQYTKEQLGRRIDLSIGP